MHLSMLSLLPALCLLITVILEVFAEDQKGDKTDEMLRKLKLKELITRVMHKPENCDALSENGDEVQVHYTGYLQTGTIFDSSEQGGKQPISVILGTGQVIKGWDQGLLGMCEGEKRRLVIPPHLAYGTVGYPPVIPPDATLMFETTLVKLRKKGTETVWENLQQYSHFLKYLVPPAVISYVFYFLYRRYEAEVQAQKEQKARRKKR